ncbi:MAG: cell division protein SepF [Clostridiales bacterium]|nr:cell division protein SepF [Clostridiales bacterium]
MRDFMSYDDYEEEDTRYYGAAELREIPAPRREPGEMLCQVQLECPEHYEDAAAIVAHMTVNRLIVLNLERIPREESRRLIDFLSGAAYARQEQIRRVARYTYIIAPGHAELTDDTGEEPGGIGCLF